MEPIVHYDKTTEKYRRTYFLGRDTCYLSVFLDKQKKLESISFDVEKADDYHYQIESDQLSKLCEYLQCQNNETDIVKAFKDRIKAWKDPIEIANLCRNADIKFHVHHWY